MQNYDCMVILVSFGLIWDFSSPLVLVRFGLNKVFIYLFSNYRMFLMKDMTFYFLFFRLDPNTRPNIICHFFKSLRSPPVPIGTEVAVTVRSSTNAAECHILTWGLYILPQLIDATTTFSSRFADRHHHFI